MPIPAPWSRRDSQVRATADLGLTLPAARRPTGGSKRARYRLTEDPVAASQQVKIPVAPRLAGNVVRMPRRDRSANS
jgi:hypothetical protein